MPAAINRDLGELHSAMNSKKTRAVAWIAAVNKYLAARGLSVRVTETVRTAQRQLELWRMGRNTQGQIVDNRKVVTYTQDSLHEYRVAFDWVPAKMKGEKVVRALYDTALYNAVYKAVPPAAYGLERLNWESPHVQIIGGYDTANQLKIRANQTDA